MRPYFYHRHPLFRLLALVWLAAALLTGCSQEPKQRATFITFLQTRILDRPGATIPLLGKEDKAQLGEDYASQYAVIQAFAQGIERAGSDDPAKVVEALKNGQPIDTVVGSVTFDEKGDLKNASYDINQWSNVNYAPIAK